MTLENDIRITRIDQTKQVATQAAEDLDWPNLGRYRAENEKLKTSGTDKIKTIFIGDSITEGWSLNDPEFFSRNNFVNRGVGGQTSPQMLIRFKPDAVNLKPKMIIINAGTNDIAANTGPASPEMIIDNICSMAEIGLKNDIRIALSTILPVYKYPWNEKVTNVPDRISKVNTALQKYSEKHSLIFIDFFKSMVNEQRGLKSAYGVDGVHPTKQGYEEMSNVIKNTISGTL